MSIIYEALKKMSQRDASAENDSHNESNPPQKPASSSAEVKPEGNGGQPNSHSHKSAVKNKIALALAGTTAGILITWLMMNKSTAPSTFQKIQAAKQTSSTALLNNPAVSPIKEAQPQDADGSTTLNANEELPAPETPELILNGIVLSADGNLALINEEILKVGDDIRGAKVEEITDKQVTLTFQNQEIILKK